VNARSHAISYPKFLWRALLMATDGGWLFYTWMAVLSALALVGANGWASQVHEGMALTSMSDHVSWGLYIANFTFAVGLAAGGVMMVIPAYLYRDRAMHDVVIVGELLAIAALVMALLFVVVDLGRPDRFWHLVPVIGRFLCCSICTSAGTSSTRASADARPTSAGTSPSSSSPSPGRSACTR